ncbi:MAG: hypothetical protein ACRELW_07820, partial [Candidatus Rokuibacteriota bacterium]
MSPGRQKSAKREEADPQTEEASQTRRAMSPKGEEANLKIPKGEEAILEVRNLVKHFQVGGGWFGGPAAVVKAVDG